MTDGKHTSLKTKSLLKAARSKFLSAQALLESETVELEGEYFTGYEDSVYLAGYALELILKRYIAIKLGWNEYPPCDDGVQSFNIHDLNRLLKFSGLYKEMEADGDLRKNWDTALKWRVTMRYSEPNKMTYETGKEILDSILHMIKWIIKKT